MEAQSQLEQYLAPVGDSALSPVENFLTVLALIHPLGRDFRANSGQWQNAYRFQQSFLI